MTYVFSRFFLFKLHRIDKSVAMDQLQSLEITLIFCAFIFGFILCLIYFFMQRTQWLVEKKSLELEKQQLLQELESTQALQAESEKNKNFEFLKEQSRVAQKEQSEVLNTLLSPLKEKLLNFEKKVEETYNREAQERFHLKKEVEKLAQSNLNIQQEAMNLTRALKGDNKVQGNWGEMILESLLEKTGLREGHEYTIQGKDLKLKTRDGRTLKPDVVIHIPGGKNIIVDSKVSLVHYERYVNSEGEDKKEQLNLFLKSIKKHIMDLSSKHYQSAVGMNSPDFVFLFLPIEAAFLEINRADNKIFSQAWDRKIVLVGPSTLFPTLSTVSSLWRNEKQNTNAIEIARQAGRLYDKFVLFLADIQRIGKSIEDSQKSYHSAINKLKEGRGNLISSTEKLKELGAKAEKNISQLMEKTP